MRSRTHLGYTSRMLKMVLEIATELKAAQKELAAAEAELEKAAGNLSKVSVFTTNE